MTAVVLVLVIDRHNWMQSPPLTANELVCMTCRQVVPMSAAAAARPCHEEYSRVTGRLAAAA